MSEEKAEALVHRTPLIHRKGTGWLLLLLMILMSVVLPVWGLEYASSRGVTFGAPMAFVAGGGAALTLLFFMALRARPTPWYGPLKSLSALTRIGYVIALSGLATATYTLESYGRLVRATVDLGGLVLLFLIPPVLGLVSALLFLAQDAEFPGVRERREAHEG